MSTLVSPQLPKMPKAPKMPTSPLDKQINLKPDSTALAYKSLISTSPMGQVKPANGQKKSLLGGA